VPILHRDRLDRVLLDAPRLVGCDDAILYGVMTNLADDGLLVREGRSAMPGTILVE
jgi:hypothetical protein